MIKHYCTNCFRYSLAYEKYFQGICPHCKSYVIMAKTRKEAKEISRVIKEDKNNSVKELDEKAKRFLSILL